MSAFLLLPVFSMAGETKSAPGSIDEMQSQIMELQEKVSALKQIKKKKEETNPLQIENKKLYSKMAQTQNAPKGMSMREEPGHVPSLSKKNGMFEFYGGATTWSHYRTNNEVTSSTGVKNANDGMDTGYSMDLFMESNLGDHHKFVVYGEVGNGNGVNSSLGTFDTATGQYGGLYSTPNYDAYHHNLDGHFQLSAAYYEGQFLDERLLLSIGKMDIHSMYDENELAGDETTQFMSNIFVRSTGVSFHELDNYYAPGLRTLFAPIPSFEISLILANSNYEDVDEKGLAVVQVNFKPANILYGGNYRFFWVLDKRKYTRVNGSGNDDNIGWGLSFDQRFTDWLGGFFRASMMEKDIIANAVHGTWALGTEINGILWDRQEDAFALACGIAWVNQRVPNLPNHGDEKHFEAYYRYSVNEYIAISPNIQLIFNQPRTDSGTLAIFGLRGQFNFRL
jgi:regulator of replication initiation timing/peptide methionine sulfoxide reductase MsrA